MLQFNFLEETFSRIVLTVQKYVFVKISSAKISYNIYKRNLRNDARSMLREREREKNRVEATILAIFLINIFFFVYYENINHLVSKQE